MSTHSDPVIARYMQAVRDLSPRMRTTLDVDLWYPFRTWMWITMPLVIPVLAHLAVLSWVAERRASSARDRDEGLCYQLFFAELEQHGWTLPGRAKVAGVLLLLRNRHGRHAEMLRLYETSSVGRLVRKEAIGLTAVE